MAEFSLPCRTASSDSVTLRAVNANSLISLRVSYSDRVSVIYLTPEDVLRFAQEALRIADDVAETCSPA